jgi:hypothetical protein
LQDRLTFATQAREHLSNVRKEGRAEMTMRKLEWLLAMAIEVLGDRPIADITAPEEIGMTLCERIAAKIEVAAPRKSRTASALEPLLGLGNHRHSSLDCGSTLLGL